MWETDRMRRTSLALEQLTYLNDKDGTIRVAPRRIFTPIYSSSISELESPKKRKHALTFCC